MNKTNKIPYKTQLKNKLPKGLKAYIKSSFLFKIYTQSAGNWIYPFLELCWLLVRFINRPRKLLVDGIELKFPCENWITHFRWYLFKKKEPEVRHYINEYTGGDDVFFDIGANIGVFSIYAAKRHPSLSVYSFEPEFSNLNTLKNNIESNGLSSRIKIYSTAIGNFVGMSSLHLQDLTAGSAAHTESKEPISYTDEGYPVICSVGVISTTVDYICDQLGVVPNSMKIDTDGNEGKILDGAKKTLSNKLFRSLIIEVPDGKVGEHCYKILELNGFENAWYDAKTKNQIWKRK